MALYLRVSTDDKGRIVENQREPLQVFCRAQGWTALVEYVDEAPAPDLRSRRAWRELLEATATRQVNLVVVWRLDRTARTVLDAAQTLERLLRAWGVGLRSYTEPYLDTTSPFGEVVLYSTMAYAQLERGILSERTKAGMDRARRQGSRIDRPPVTTRSGFSARWATVHEALGAGPLSRAAACRPLGVGYATLLRLLAAETGLRPEAAESGGG